MTKAFSVEDKNLQVRSLVVSRVEDYSDIDPSFDLKTNGDVYRKLDAAAVKQSVKNIVLTGLGEKPFQPNFGTNLRELLFENYDFSLSLDAKNRIRDSIQTYEPRASIQKINTKWDEGNHHLLITLIFKIVNTLETVTLNVTLSRVR